jgi:replicative DNA helicase
MSHPSGKGIRIPPHNTEAEVALLGSLMLRPDVMYEIFDFIRPSSFYAERHARIFETMLELFNKGTPIDMLSITSRLTEKNMLDAVGGASYVAELAQAVPSAANARHYADIVHKKYMMRRLIEASDRITSHCYEDAGELEEILDIAEKQVYDVTNVSTSHRFIHLKDALTEAWERFDRLQQSPDELRGVPSGFKDLDNKLSGFQKSDLIILAARPSVGKTTLALDIARQTAITHGVPVGIFSLEMSSQQLVDRMLAAESRVDAWKLRTGKVTDQEDFERLKDGIDRLSSAPLFIDDQPGNNILKMRSTARRLKSERNIGMLIVDYLQLITPSNTRTDNVVQQVTEISRALKQLARELEVPVIALSQLSREVEKRGGRPRLSDLRDSGSIEQDADVVMFIHREDRMKEDSDRPNIAEIMIEKHRNGPTGKVELYFDDKKGTFLSIEKSNFQAFQATEADF